MASISIEKHSEHPIVVVTITGMPAYDDPVKASEMVMPVIQSFSGRCVRIMDFSGYRMDFSVLVQGLANDPYLHDSKVVTVFVGDNDLVRLGTEAARQDQYGSLELPLFATLDEAMHYAPNALDVAA